MARPRPNRPEPVAAGQRSTCAARAHPRRPSSVALGQRWRETRRWSAHRRPRLRRSRSEAAPEGGIEARWRSSRCLPDQTPVGPAGRCSSLGAYRMRLRSRRAGFPTLRTLTRPGLGGRGQSQSSQYDATASCSPSSEQTCPGTRSRRNSTIRILALLTSTLIRRARLTCSVAEARNQHTAVGSPTRDALPRWGRTGTKQSGSSRCAWNHSRSTLSSSRSGSDSLGLASRRYENTPKGSSACAKRM
jgi:hypothetical protein